LNEAEFKRLNAEDNIDIHAAALELAMNSEDDDSTANKDKNSWG
jgi:hypothetical protein